MIIWLRDQSRRFDIEPESTKAAKLRRLEFAVPSVTAEGFEVAVSTVPPKIALAEVTVEYVAVARASLVTRTSLERAEASAPDAPSRLAAPDAPSRRAAPAPIQVNSTFKKKISYCFFQFIRLHLQISMLEFIIIYAT